MSQANYEAYYADDITSGLAPTWDHVRDDIAAKWCRAAEASIQAFLSNISLDMKFDGLVEKQHG